MADSKISALTATTTPASTDILPIVVDPGGTPLSRKVTVANLFANAPATVVTSAAAAAFAVGPNGNTNPAFRVVGNVASAATGLSVTGNAAGAGVTLTALSSGSNEDVIVAPKGTGSVVPGTHNGFDLGSSAVKWRTGNFGTSVISPIVNVNSEVLFETGGSRAHPSYQLRWGTSVSGASQDTGVGRAAAKVVEINAGSAGSAGVLLLRGQAFASLPASPVAGMHATVTDSSTATWGATITGGGANVVHAFYNGTNWIVN